MKTVLAPAAVKLAAQKDPTPQEKPEVIPEDVSGLGIAADSGKVTNPYFGITRSAPPAHGGPRLGAIVNYVLADGRTVRPAIVVAISPTNDRMLNLHVFLDGKNDITARGAGTGFETISEWRTGVKPTPKLVDDQGYFPHGAGTWH
jgi:hypothetical protein